MAIKIDTVYQTVQALANKEQRGYITPQEFNLFANQAQDDIFDQYLYDLEAFRAQRPEKNELGDSVTQIMKKLSTWYSIAAVTNGVNLPAGNVGKIFLGQGAVRRTLKEVDPDMVSDFYASKWHKQGFTDAVFFRDGDKQIQVWDKTGQIKKQVSCEQINTRPGLVYWGYMIVNEKPVYDPSVTANFSLDRSEQADIIVKILKLAGISIEDQQLFAAAQGEDSLNTQQENK